MNSNQSWRQMMPNGEDDFGDLLNDVNIGDFNDIDFTEFDVASGDPNLLAFGDGNGIATSGPGWQPQSGPPIGAAFAAGPHGAMNLAQQQGPPGHPREMTSRYGTMTRPGVPPTPNSLEMQGKHRNFSGTDAPQQRSAYDGYSGKQQDQMVFTPLVSPAVTPQDAHFPIPEYAVPGEYFSPLNSPAITAQNNYQRSMYGSVHDSGASDAASPSDMEIDTSPSSAAGPASARKGKKAIKSQPSARAVRNSPAMKAQRKKAPTSSGIAAKGSTGIHEELIGSGAASEPRATRLPVPPEQNSAASSISPEPLSDILMPPPAVPRSGSKGHSPHLAALDSPSIMGMGNGPVTPATLMRIQSNASASPRASGSRSAPLAPIDTSEALRPDVPNTEGLPTPTLAAADIRSSSTISRAVPPSPTSASGTPRIAPKGKKRAGESQPSPALRPKISPNIKPLLPQGANLSAETSALLLASKSNYQNILEGTHLPGVTYPKTLSTALTSKRTSHKLAEQGRRNRMNVALQELAGMLPATGSPMEGAADAAKESPSAKGQQSAANREASSKASTVELAIDFIRALQSELDSVKGRLEVTERRLNEVEANSAGTPSERGTEASSTS